MVDQGEISIEQNTMRILVSGVGQVFVRCVLWLVKRYNQINIIISLVNNGSEPTVE